MKERSQLWREKAQPSMYGALFGPEEMRTLGSICSTWTSRLRQTLELLFLTVGPPTPEFWRTRQADILGVGVVLERQHRAGSTPLGDYNALQGRLRHTIRPVSPPNSLIKTLYIDGNTEEDVLVEARSDNETPVEFMCHLTWLLQAPMYRASSEQDVVTNRYQLHTLSCMGFIDDPINARTLILYRSPQSHPWAANPPSLHDLISRGPTSRLSLGNRFSTARALAATLLETHASGWIHGNVHSRNVAMLPRDLNDPELSPSLVGWGVLQPLEGSHFALEPNLYRHHDRFGKPSSEYANEHDIYSLGVLLLELGLWRTVAMMFARRLAQNPRFSAVQQHDVFNRMHNATLDLANGIDIEREMGKRYAQVVLKCLTWHFHNSVESMIEFRKQVVDELTPGFAL